MADGGKSYAVCERRGNAMSRYIDAEYIKAVMINDRLMQGNAEINLYMQQVETQVKAMPSIDIVRCKDCKHCHYEQEDDIYHCYKLFHRFYDTEHYCSYGERKTDHE